MYDFRIRICLNQIHIILSRSLRLSCILFFFFLLFNLPWWFRLHDNILSLLNLNLLFFLIKFFIFLFSYLLKLLQHLCSLIDCVTYICYRFRQIMFDVLLLRQSLVWVRHDVWHWRQIVGFWVLNSVSSEDSNPVGGDVYPFIPTSTPSIVVNVNLIVSNVCHLCFEPLINSVFCINPHPNFKFSIFKTKLLQILVVLRIIRWILVSLSLPESPIIFICLMVFFF